MKTRVAYRSIVQGGLGVLLVLVFAGWGFEQSRRASFGQEKPATGTNAAARKATSPPDLAADIDSAIKMLEANDLGQFLELYAPVEILREVRKSNDFDNTVSRLKSQPEFKLRFLVMLKKLKTTKPQFDKSKGLATFQIDMSQFEQAASDAPTPSLPETSELALHGLGGDLPKMLSAAIDLLDKQEYAKFVEAVFPPTELAKLKQEGDLQALLQQFELTPELRTSMLADFRRMQAATPKISEKDQVAELALKAAAGLSARTVKLQKFGGDWRLYDDAPRVVGELARIAKLKPAGMLESILMERIGGNWRFASLNSNPQ